MSANHKQTAINNPADFFVAGGTLRPRAQSYVTRPADDELLKRVQAGDFCYVLTPRQMGKSSLMVRTARRLTRAGSRTAIVDLTSIGADEVPAEAWYQGLLTRLQVDLRLSVDVQSWWAERHGHSVSQRFIEFLHDVVLAQMPEPVTIFIDEIDSTLKLDFTDDFFAAIRFMYNARTTDPLFERLTFVLLGVATPSDLIKDQTRTPFNIGRRIELEEFSREDARILAEGLEATYPGQGDLLLSRIFYWTNGHPYLTQKLCLAAVNAPLAAWDEQQVDHLVAQNFLADEADDDNLKSVQNNIRARSENERRQMLKLYRDVHAGKAVRSDHRSLVQNYLALFGLIRVAQERLQVRNEIYRQVFDQTWVRENTPTNTQQRVAIFASLVAIILVALITTLILTRQDPPAIRAQLCREEFETATSRAVQLVNLACLFNLGAGYDKEARELFYTLSPRDQQLLFLQDDPEAVGAQLVDVIRGVYVSLDQMEGNHDLAIMAAMEQALEDSNQPAAASLTKEIRHWKEGREYADAEDYAQAIDSYATAIAFNENKNHPVVYYDRAMVFIELDQFGNALADLEQIVIIAKAAPPTPTPTPTLSSPTPTTTPTETYTPTPGSTRNPTSAATGEASPESTSEPPTQTRPTPSPTNTTEPPESVIGPDLRFINSDQIIQTIREKVNQLKILKDYLLENKREYPELAALYLPPIAVTMTAEAEKASEIATATAMAAAELAVPTQTALAATTQAEAAIAEQTADAELIEGALAARDATVTAVTMVTAVAAEVATAEAQANVTPTPTPTDTPIPADTPTLGPLPNTPTKAPPTDTPTLERPTISGKLAFPVDDGAGKYDVHVVSMPDGNQLGITRGVRQPHLRRDGAKLLVNGQGGGFGENVFEANPGGSIERAVSGSPTDSYAVYNPDGGRIAYSNPQLAIGVDGDYHSYIFVQCGTIPPSQEGDQTCQDIARFGILVPDGQVGEIQGSNPVWAANDHIIYKGCDSWAGGDSCGIFTVGSWANNRSSNGETPRKIADGTSLIPTDTKGNLVAFHSRQSGDWEAYVMSLDGGGMINISNSPTSSDGLPTISPDGQWVAFASDREGSWAVYVAPVAGGTAAKLFDFPKPNPWSTGDRDWTTERISWGP